MQQTYAIYSLADVYCSYNGLVLYSQIV